MTGLSPSLLEAISKSTIAFFSLIILRIVARLGDALVCLSTLTLTLTTFPGL